MSPDRFTVFASTFQTDRWRVYDTLYRVVIFRGTEQECRDYAASLYR